MVLIPLLNYIQNAATYCSYHKQPAPGHHYLSPPNWSVASHITPLQSILNVAATMVLLKWKEDHVSSTD
jgi:hypothetical protein